MYDKSKKPYNTSIRINQSYVGERIEEKIERVLNNKEPITDGAPVIYTSRKDGVQPDYNIRTDRFDAAIEAMDYVSKSHITAREQRLVIREKEKGQKTTLDAGTAAATNDSTK